MNSKSTSKTLKLEKIKDSQITTQAKQIIPIHKLLRSRPNLASSENKLVKQNATYLVYTYDLHQSSIN